MLLNGRFPIREYIKFSAVSMKTKGGYMDNNAVLEKIIEIINLHLEEEITKEQFDEDLTKLGMDSIIFIRIVVTLEEEFDCEIPDDELLMMKMGTVNEIMKVLMSIPSNLNTQD